MADGTVFVNGGEGQLALHLYPESPFYRASDPFGMGSFNQSVTISDGLSTSFDEAVSAGDVIYYESSTAAGMSVSVSVFGEVSFSAPVGSPAQQLTSGDTFSYRINSGENQTFTVIV